jgi:hypothetical protein
MFIALGIGITVVIALFLGRTATETSQVSDAIARARQTGEIDGLVEIVEAHPPDKRATKWDHVLGELWQAYARREAAKLVVEAAQRSDDTILQYWIRQVLEVEPDIAQEVFTEAFLEEHFRPDVAARCGKSCGC